MKYECEFWYTGGENADVDVDNYAYDSIATVEYGWGPIFKVVLEC